jgi:TonB family protein
MKRSKEGVYPNWFPCQLAAVNEYRPTILESGILVERLATEIKFLHDEFRNILPQLKRNPASVVVRIALELSGTVKRILLAPNVMSSCVTALLFVGAIMLLVFTIDKRQVRPIASKMMDDEIAGDVRILDLTKTNDLKGRESSGMGSNGRVGYNRDRGEGSNAERKRAQGGGSGGNNDTVEAQRGKIPLPSAIQAAIPKTAPLNPPTLPAAGIDLDPAVWRDLKLPVYGNPQSQSEIPSNGPGTGGGMGNNRGTGVGTGDGPGVGPGSDGNTGGGPKQTGCCGPGGGSDDNSIAGERILRPNEVEQRVRVLAKPEPNYTDEARKNQITGTVVLRVIFSSLGQVEQIRTVQQLPFGLTERAIAAARQIRFLPATRGGRPVSVYMQLEYNFNLY